MPFQAGVAGEAIPRAKFVRGEDRNLSTDQIYEKHGPVNGQIANDVIRRYRASQGIQSDGFAAPKSNPVVAQKAAPMQEPLAGISYNEIAPDPWTTPPATGNGITQEVARRSSKSAVTPLLSASPPSKEYKAGGNFKADGPNDYRTNVRSEADYRQSVRNLGRVRGFGRNAAIAGGAVAGLAGLDALIGGESDKRKEEVYQ